MRKDQERWLKDLVKVGADPRRRVRSLGPRYDVEWFRTALKESVRVGTYRVMLFLGMRKTDDFETLLEEACWDFDIAKIKHIIHRTGKSKDPKAKAFFFIGHNDLCKNTNTPEEIADAFEANYLDALNYWESNHRGGTAYLMPVGKI